MSQLTDAIILGFLLFFTKQTLGIVNHVLNVPESSDSNFEISYTPSPDDPSIPVEKHSINLEQEPIHRWTSLINGKKRMVLAFHDYVVDLLGSTLYGTLVHIVKESKKHIPEEFLMEMKGISHTLETNEDNVILLNIFYEISALCTSIVALDAQDHVIHGRNMDFGLFLGWDEKKKNWILPEYLRNLTVNVSFKKNNQSVYQVVTFAGLVGVFTGMKNHEFTLSLNARMSPKIGIYGMILQWLLNRKSHFSGFFLRQVLDEAKDYEHAVQLCSNSLLIASGYIIIAGVKPNEGVVLTRGTEKTIDTWRLNESETQWFLLQTNSDHWSSLNPDGRKLPGYKLMNDVGKAKFTSDQMYSVLDHTPLRNKLTVYSTIMSAGLNKFDSFLKYCDQTCTLW